MSETRQDGILALIRKKYPEYHPLVSLADIAHDEGANLKLKAECHITIAKYTEQQLKAVEVTANVKSDFGVMRVILASDDDEANGDSEGAVDV